MEPSNAPSTSSPLSTPIGEMSTPAKATQLSSPIVTTSDARIQLTESRVNPKWKSLSRALAFCAGIALGIFTALAIAGTMVTPIGWAIAGLVLLAALIMSLKHGGIEFFKTLGVAFLGWTSGLALIPSAFPNPGYVFLTGFIDFIWGICASFKPALDE